MLRRDERCNSFFFRGDVPLPAFGRTSLRAVGSYKPEAGHVPSSALGGFAPRKPLRWFDPVKGKMLNSTYITTRILHGDALKYR